MDTPPDSSTASRLLALLALLQGRRDWPGPELARRLGVSARTVRRDVDRLRALGYPIESLSGPGGGYALHAGTAMPPLLLDDEEATAIAVGLRAAVGSAVAGIEETSLRALVKLEQVLPAHLRRRVQTLTASTSAIHGDGPTIDPQAITLLATAARDEETVRFAYRARDDARTRRVVEPHALVTVGRRWYLVAFDPARTGWRSFRVDRMEGIAAGGARFTKRNIPGGDPAAFVQRGLRDRWVGYEAKVTYHAPIDEVRRRAPKGFGPLEPLGDQACTATLTDDDLTWLALRLAIADVPFTVEGPPELLTHLRALSERFAAAVAE
jgi:predicted DNA-binding transcriptional regulator YafY